MLIDNHVETYIEENILPQQHVRRLANGSIDFTFYNRRVCSDRGVALRAAGRSVSAFIQRLVALLTYSRLRLPSYPLAADTPEQPVVGL